MTKRKMNEISPLEALIDNAGLKLVFVQEKTGITKKQWYARRDNPNLFTTGEILKLATVLNKGYQEVFEAIVQQVIKSEQSVS